ncbi:MAG: hypothetical protein WKF97_12035 [Chitinophagaceae bacterium]
MDFSTISILKTGDATAANQRVLPSGLDAGRLLALTGETGLTATHGQTRLCIIIKNPYILLPYAEVEFLRAEAIVACIEMRLALR